MPMSPYDVATHVDHYDLKCARHIINTSSLKLSRINEQVLKTKAVDLKYNSRGINPIRSST